MLSSFVLFSLGLLTSFHHRPLRFDKRGRAALIAFTLLPLAQVSAQPVSAQEGALRPGEAFVTRFSGVTIATGPAQRPAFILDLGGTVGSIIDLRAPGQPPRGHHWVDEPQRKPVTAGDVGQVFGVALDDALLPNIYLTATSVFGLHRTADNAQWMPGMWGPGGPGAIYKLDGANGYKPGVFAQITLDGRPNSAAALGNIAFDRWNKQFFVSDLETGMIHRIRATGGADLGRWDHGVQGRANFFDAEEKQAKSLAPIAFNASSRARIADCPTRRFSTSPECWNLAESGRRVWGVGVMRDAAKNEVRLYYSVWSSPAFANAAWASLPDDEKRNSIWSVRLGPDGGFDPSDVRREFLLPDFFVKPEDVVRAGFSQPVSDISFPTCGDRPVMLVAERGGIRNLGLGIENAFAFPHESRALRYQFDQEGTWRSVGRYDVGFYERKNEGEPILRANCAGGAAFGYGYDTNAWTIDPAQPDRFVWISGDSLCSPAGPCNLPGVGPMSGAESAPAGQGVPGQPDAAVPASAQSQSDVNQQFDESEVHGIQGLAEDAFDELVPASAFAAAQSGGEAYASAGLNQAYLIDTDINIDQAGGIAEEQLHKNDATMIGDVAIYEICAAPSVGFMPLPPPVLIGGHAPSLSHALYASHGRRMSHYRFGSHAPEFSHNRFGSHYRIWSHQRTGSHNREWSHNRYGSHNRNVSHSRLGSHNRALSHFRVGSHNPQFSHSRFKSHNPQLSHNRFKSHNPRLSHSRVGSHNPKLSHARIGSHNLTLSHSRIGSHNPKLSHARIGSQRTPPKGVLSPSGTHNRALSQQQRAPVKSTVPRATTQQQIRKKLHDRRLSIQQLPSR